MTHVALFDYGAGNLHSLAKGLEAGGARVTVTTDWSEALGRDGLVLPGVGSFGAAVRGIEGRADEVRSALEDGLPCLGICLGMQLLFPESEESAGLGIGLLPGVVRRIRAEIVPQMGWNDIEAERDPLFDGTGEFSAYFANSFVCDPTPDASEAVIARATYGEDHFAAGVRSHRTWGLQFHPEKSSHAGLRILANWVALVGGV